MKFSLALQTALLAASVASAAKKTAISEAAGIFERQTICDGTCAECYGDGNIRCGILGCYDPTAGEQCCADETYCVGDASCCSENGGTLDGDGDSFPSPTASSDDGPSAVSTNPGSLVTGTCQGTCAECFGDSNISCGLNGCYAPSQGEQCCADETFCIGDEDCCDPAGGILDGNDTSPNPSSSRGLSLNTGATQRPSSTGGNGGNPRTTTTSANGASSTLPIAGGPDTPNPPAGDAVRLVQERVTAVAAALLGFAFL